MKYAIGDTQKARINKIQENGCYCSLTHSQFGFMPNKMMPSYFDENGNLTKSVGDQVTVVVNKISNNGFITLSDISWYEKMREIIREREEKAIIRQRNTDFVSKFELGTKFKAGVLKVRTSMVIIKVEDIQGIIRKEDTNWNEIDRLEDLLFEGETVEVVYIEHKNNKLFFSLKLLNEKPYDEDLYNLSLLDLLKFTGHESNVFIGIAKQYHYGLFIENLYSTSVNQRGKLLVDPFFGYNLRAIVPNANFNIEENKYYKIEIELAPKNKRLERNQLFQFVATNIVETENPYKADVNLTFAKSTSPRDCAALAHTLAEVGKNMYSSKDRMFFELVQNADDAAAQKGVNINVKSEGDFLIMRHNGKSFDKDDFDAITSSANGTKKANENKTGYKGIGFKSVFTDSEIVFIKTGGYQFKFDKNDPRFINFEKFYFFVNGYNTEQQKKDFLQKFCSERSKFRGVSDIPWQLEPIWIDQFPAELGEDFTQSNVAIALKLGISKIAGGNGYEKAISDIIKDPRFMLFLRNTKRIDFNGQTISKTIKDGIIILKKSFGTNRVEYFKRKDFEIDINNENFEQNDIDVRIVVEEYDENSGKIIEAKFVDTHNNELENIPKKIAINNSTTISFAIPIDEDGVLKPNTQCNEISMFAFLPTLVKDFKFPFYINANFILDPPRQRILGDNPWNFYLMQEIARLLILWSESLSKKHEKEALNVLLQTYFEENGTDIKQLAEHFNSAYKSTLETEAFILNHNGEFAKQEDIIIDKTGLSEIVGSNLFCQMLDTRKCLPFEDIDCKILEKDIFEFIEKKKFDDIIGAITNNSDFNDWFKSATEEQKEALYKWIDKNNSETHIGSLHTFVSYLPLFQFDSNYKSCKEIESSEYLITTEHIEPITRILSKLGFVCSNNFFDEKDPLYDFVELQDEEDLFETIKDSDFSKLTIDERKSLFFALADFEGVGDAKLEKSIALFRNMNGKFKPLGEMVSYHENVPSWLFDYVLCKEDDDRELAKYLIAQEDEFDSVVQKNIEEINATWLEVYNSYKNEWSGQFTRQIIDKYGINDDILVIVEESDTETKRHFLNRIPKLNLQSSSTYKKDSPEYRILQLALEIYEMPSDFSSKIYIDEKCIKDFSITDEVICKYTQNGEEKNVKMSLAKLLPQYKNVSDSIDKFINLFEIRKGLNKFFNAEPLPLDRIVKSLEEKDSLGLSPGEWKYNINGNAYQYLFYVYYYNGIKEYTSRWVISIKLEKETDTFVNEMMDFLFANNISIKESPFTYRIKHYFYGKYLSDDYLFDDEKLLPSIRIWVDNDKKRQYLLQNGVLNGACNNIMFRSFFLEDKPIKFLDELSYQEKSMGIKYFACANEIKRPFKGDNQKDILLKLFSESKFHSLKTVCNFDILSSKSEEWGNSEYKDWIKDHYPHILLFDGELPLELLYEDVVLLQFSKDHYIYDSISQKLYISREENLDQILFQLARDGKSGLNLDDYKILCMNGKISISKDVIETKDEQISLLTKENIEKEELLKRYREKFGDIDKISGQNPPDGQNTQEEGHSTDKKDSTKISDDEEEAHGEAVDRGSVNEESRIELNLEARIAAKEYLDSLNDYDCSDWDPNEGNGLVKDLIRYKNKTITVVVTSSIGRKLHLHPRLFAELMIDSDNLLLNYGYDRKIHHIVFDETFKDNPNVNLIFDTDIITHKEFAFLANRYKYSKRTCFAIENFAHSISEQIKGFGLDEVMSDSEVYTNIDTDILFDF